MAAAAAALRSPPDPPLLSRPVPAALSPLSPRPAGGYLTSAARPGSRGRRASLVLCRADSSPGAGGMALYVGLDVGTQGTKAVVYDGTKVVGRGSFAYALLPSADPRCGEQHPDQWKEGIVASVRAALEGIDATQVKGLGVSGQQHGFVPVDAEGGVIRNCKLWCDSVSSDEADELSAKFGWPVLPAFTCTKVLWMKRNEPENFARLAKVMLPHDWCNFWLTGKWAMECGDASGTGLVDVETRGWRKEWAEAIDPSLPSLLPPTLADPNAPLGEVLPGIAEELGFPPGVIVSPGGGDNMMAALGSGCVSEGRLVMSLGTSGTLFGYSSSPVFDETGSIAPFLDSTGAWLPLACTQNCTTVTEEARKGFGLDNQEATKLAGVEPVGCEGVNFLPYLAGARTPNWPHASGALMGLRPGSLRPGLLYRAAMEGATFSLLAAFRVMEAKGLRSDEIRLVGGGSKNPVWRQIVADSFQARVRMPLEAEAAALGGAMQAAAVHRGEPVAEYCRAHEVPLADDVVEPDHSQAAAYAEAFERHVSLGKTLFG